MNAQGVHDAEFSVGDCVRIETAGGLTPVTITRLSGDEDVIVKFAEGDTAIVPWGIVHAEVTG